LLPLLDDVRHRLRRGASHLPARRSRQNVNLFLREPLGRLVRFGTAVRMVDAREDMLRDRLLTRWVAQPPSG